MTGSRHLLIIAAAPIFALPAFATASCATSDGAKDHAEDASSVIQPSDAGTPDGDAADAAPPCDPDDRSCVSDALSCDEADFCPVPNALDRRYALTAVWGSAANDVWAVGSGGSILHHDGSGWKAVPSGTTDTLTAVWGSGAGDVWAAGSPATILHGPTWTNERAFINDELSPSGRILTVWGASGAGVWMGGEPFAHVVYEPDYIYEPGNHLQRSGDTWVVHEGFEGRYLEGTIRSIWGSSAEDVWVSIDDGRTQPWARGTLLHGTPPAPGEPLAWTSVDSQSSVPLEAIWGSSAGDVWAVGLNATIRRFSSGATKWAVVDDAPTHAALHGVWGSGPKDVWIVGDAGTILHFDGTTWTEATIAFPLGKKPNLVGVWGSGPNDVWVVGAGYTLHYTGKKAGQ